MNKVVLVGRLTKDPELRFAAGSGSAVCRFTVAVNRQFKKDETDFINCTLWRGIAESTAEYCKKGDLVGIKGRIQTSNYQDSEGNKKYTTEVVAEKVTFLSKNHTKEAEETE